MANELQNLFVFVVSCVLGQRAHVLLVLVPPHAEGESPVSGPKGIFSNCLPCPAKRVSAYSVVNN